MQNRQVKSIGQWLFSFVVVADTHVNERDDTSSSPFAGATKSNDRARHVFQDIAAMQPQPKFVVHLGDIVHPVPSQPAFHDAAARFREITTPVRIPIHLVPGNHDVGDKCIEWMPAGQVCDSYLHTYREVFGSDYFAFEEAGVRFIVVNALLLNSGLADEAVQKAWLEKQIEEATDGRIFLFMHYPPYIHSCGERSNYDNIDEPGRSWLLSLVRKPGVEAVFAGHVHNFWYDRIGEAEFYMLPSTAFLRHDFTEFYRIDPGPEFGRSDIEKYGYCVVDVHDNGHISYSVRTMGAEAKAGEPAAPRAPLRLTHPKVSTFDRVGVELRHPWTESMQITATGGVQEFGRKWARNDYPLQALWEMGVCLSKVPDQDVLDDDARMRMQLQSRIGEQFIVTTLGIPKPALLDADPHSCGVIAVEANMTPATFAHKRNDLRKIRSATGLAVFFSKIHAFDDSHYDGKHFNHFVKAGFTIAELERERAMLTGAREDGCIDGVTVRIGVDDSLLSAARQLQAFARASGCKVLASLKTSGPNLATPLTDDRGLVARTAQAMILSKTSGDVSYLFDTFMDVDRGYFPRHAFIDRRFNRRPAAKAFATINALLSGAGAIELSDASDDLVGTIGFQAGGASYLLFCGDTQSALARLTGERPESIVHDLVAGREDSVARFAATSRSGLPQNNPDLQVLLVRRM